MSKEAQPLISMRGVRRSFAAGDEETTVLHDVDLDIRRGEFVAIIGSSGSGKSTLMNVLGLLDRPTAGSYLYDGQDTGTMDAEALAATSASYSSGTSFWATSTPCRTWKFRPPMPVLRATSGGPGRACC